ncbi:hypothetical protein AAP_04678 [Ascosphaera apis ARSEF 7405]|uniref:Uncharacterized protein n=1 Tax=Ascosphaera apis ARSEF 7405 TaxID=392613 RepID=A0A167WIC4_9EURO|nr:hypothetical protein AAP_04678 [Ascosphaera apis ARSEF 7405]
MHNLTNTTPIPRAQLLKHDQILTLQIKFELESYLQLLRHRDAVLGRGCGRGSFAIWVLVVVGGRGGGVVGEEWWASSCGGTEGETFDVFALEGAGLEVR